MCPEGVCEYCLDNHTSCYDLPRYKERECVSKMGLIWEMPQSQHTRTRAKLIILNIHTLLPAIETTDAIGNTENKQVKRNMSKYFQHMFMLISFSLGYLFYDTYS